MSFFEPIYLDIDLSSKQPVVRQTNPRYPINYKPSTNKIKNILYIELPEYKSKNIQVAINKSGKVTVNASKTNIIQGLSLKAGHFGMKNFGVKMCSSG